MFKISKNSHMTPARWITASFLLIAILGGFLLYLPISSISEKSPPLIDCIFTAVSAVCVTGLVTLDTATTWSTFGKSVILLLIQIGGIGLVTIITYIMLTFKKRVSLSNKLIILESLNQDKEVNISTIIKKVTNITLFIEILGAIAMSFYFIPNLGLGKGVLFSIFHSVSAFCNAGFDLMGQISGEFSSLSSLYNNHYLNFVIAILIILGGIGFLTISEILEKKSFKKLSLHSKIVLTTTAALITIGTIFIFVFEFNNTLGNLTITEKFTASYFQSVTSRTAGFNTINLSAMNISTMVVFYTLMIIGSSPLSTGGGIKTTTLFCCLVFVRNSILDEDFYAFKRKIPTKTIYKALSTLVLAIVLICIFITTISAIETSLGLKEVTFEVVSALATVGLSLGVTPTLSITSKILLMIAMFIGRVGAITLFLAFSKRDEKVKIKYIEDTVLI